MPGIRSGYSPFQIKMMRDVIAQYPGTATALKYQDMLAGQNEPEQGEGVQDGDVTISEELVKAKIIDQLKNAPGARREVRPATPPQLGRIAREIAKRDLSKVNFGLFGAIKTYEAGTIGSKAASELIDWLTAMPLKTGATSARPATDKQVTNIAKWGPAREVDAATEATIAKAVAGEPITFDEAHKALDVIFDENTPRKAKTPAAKVETKTETMVEGSPEVIYDGTYTVTFADGSYKTLKLRTQKADARFRPGVQLVKFLSGPDNTSDYTGFGEVHGGTVKIWRKFADNADLAKACKVMLGAPDAEEGATFEVSVSCFRCGRPLTVPASMHNGYGPDCINM